MAYDEDLAARVSDAIGVRPDVVERKMFGGIAWMLSGNMAVGVIREELLVRLPHDEAAEALLESNVRPFEMGRGTARGFVLVAPDAVADEDALGRWVDRGADFAASLPPK